MAASFGGISQGRMSETEPGAHTIKTHGAKVAKKHKHDWLILLLLVVIDVVLNVIHPFYRFVGKDMMTDLKYPLKDNTVPVWAVPIYAVLLPIVVFLLIYIRRRDVYDLHHSILGLLFAVLITGVLTDAIKDGVGRPRPDFFWRCFPDGVDKYDQWGNVVCTGEDSVIKEGHKSFPSGHTAWSFAGLGFLALYLAGKIEAFNRKGHVAKLCIVFLPLLLAALIHLYKLDIAGFSVATFCYLQFFPPPYHTQGWGPYAYFRALEKLEKLRLNTRLGHPSNGPNVQAAGAQVMNQQMGLVGNAFTPEPEEDKSSDAFIPAYVGHISSSSEHDEALGKSWSGNSIAKAKLNVHHALL
ncbi:hypothetical protein RHGRI_026832 [Rhododendron griersonianum]|uniref:Phosphatidic acid phosphatase type 2/haloperoxidase domain-containing protein n=1 Tax=Rhododendron griersonianum TaxID=479676 RepID=A0AAV6IY48_9ERIC|nr:hypothetical protein RHGRI_026832 [Rhododendron griersonianum]